MRAAAGRARRLPCRPAPGQPVRRRLPLRGHDADGGHRRLRARPRAPGEDDRQLPLGSGRRRGDARRRVPALRQEPRDRHPRDALPVHVRRAGRQPAQILGSQVDEAQDARQHLVPVDHSLQPNRPRGRHHRLVRDPHHRHARDAEAVQVGGPVGASDRSRGAGPCARSTPSSCASSSRCCARADGRCRGSAGTGSRPRASPTAAPAPAAAGAGPSRIVTSSTLPTSIGERVRKSSSSAPTAVTQRAASGHPRAAANARRGLRAAGPAPRPGRSDRREPARRSAVPGTAVDRGRSS